ncbi:TPA: hypothetical protein SL824_000578 [Pseudomonas aeruginosa]|nr:hypothetical protein [Pseudomonas aeruginosa]
MPSAKSLFTYVEAQAAVRAIGIRSQPEYQKRRREDSRLPASPDKTYANAGWTDWYCFLGNIRSSFYPTYTEAQSAVQTLGIKSRPEYEKCYRKDPKLPARTDRIYSRAGWTNWYNFFGKERPELYPTYAEAQAAAQALGIKSQPHYQKCYRENSKLPASPYKTYAGVGWTDWFSFLGKERSDFYPTYAEAQVAAQALGVKDQSHYLKRYREDPRLSIAPYKIYAGAGWTDWYNFLGEKKPHFYPTYAEAQAVVQAMGIKSQPHYEKYYRENQRLPSQPERFYADVGWTDWYDFLGKERPDLYPTYAEAQSAALVLGIKSRPDYQKCYRENPRLPSQPESFYSDAGWTNWYDFLGKERPDIYPTYAEARTAAIALGIKSRPQYLKRCYEDPRLPVHPNVSYAGAGWIDWYAFFAKKKPDLYPTYVEAKVAVQALHIKSHPEYLLRACEDPRLPAWPNTVYDDSGWLDWYDFLGNESPNAALTDYPLIWADVEKWLNTQTSIAVKRSAVRVFLGDFYHAQGLPDDARYLLLRRNLFNAEAYQQFIDAQAESMKRPYHSAIKAYFGWLLEEYCTDADADERIVLPEYRNPFETVLAGFADSLQGYRPSQSTKPPLGYEYILRARNFLVPDGEQVLQTRPSLSDLPHLQDFFDGRFDWIYVEESVIDRNDPNCIWRKVEKADRRVDGKRELVDSYQVWSPVRFVALYTLLRFPLRGQQILWLDSGEGDKEIAVLDAENGGVRWKENALAVARTCGKKRRPQGVVQRGHNDAPRLYVTTNKTGRGQGGYSVDWIPDDLLYWLLLLRDWQVKYNPLKQPTRWTDISLRVETNKKILQARGTQCFLFRTDASGQPLFTTTAFTHTLPALLYAIQRPGENLARKSGKQRFISPYTPHSLRVSLITAFIVDGDAPIHLISKLVGHASLVMTIYYTKLNNTQMRRAMGETEKRAALAATERHAEIIRTQGLQPLRHQLIATDSNRSLLDSDVPNSACVVFDYGICPMSAALCDKGGKPIAERKVESLYAPVEAGYLGQKNCPRCRFFVTGVPFLGGLVALANELALEIHTESGRFQEFSNEFERLDREYYDACHDGRLYADKARLDQMNSNQLQSAAKLDGLLADYVAVNHYVQGCLKLINSSEQDCDSNDGVRLVVASDFAVDVNVAFEESDTNYHLLAEICQNASIYQSVNPSRAVPLISQCIDRMAENNNLAPAMFRLSEEQKLVVINELNQLLLQRLGSWEKIGQLISGELMLLDIDADTPELSRISIEVGRLLSNPNCIQQLAQEGFSNA